MRIDIVTDTFAPDVNGVAMTLGRLCDGLRRRGHLVHVIRTGEGGGRTAGLNAAPMVQDIISRSAAILGVKPRFGEDGSALLVSY